MSTTYFFYDLETSGTSPKDSRIMQFAGQRTNINFEPIGEPVNILVCLSDDVLPEPMAVLITGINPQKTISEGITEAEFLRIFHDEIALPDTIFIGFNNVRFDDEFIRYCNYRNFWDPYEWHWKDGRGRWDLLDVIRMTRALRPEGINWPFDNDGKPTNRLELLTKLNGLEHSRAHDALSDVYATIAVAKLLNTKQPKIFQYLLGMRDKKQVAELINTSKPYLYSSGKYSGQFHKTTAVCTLGEVTGQNGSYVVYDLRFNPEEYADYSVEQFSALLNQWEVDYEKRQPVPFKILSTNKCPAVAPLAVLDKKSADNIKLDLETINSNYQFLINNPEIGQKILSAMSKNREFQATIIVDDMNVDSQLYQGFLSYQDKTKCSVVLGCQPNEISKLDIQFDDQRLGVLFNLYKARNFYKYLSPEEIEQWNNYRKRKLLSGGGKSAFAKYFTDIKNLSADTEPNTERAYLLEELRLWGESILPTDS